MNGIRSEASSPGEGAVGVGPPPNGQGIHPNFQLANIAMAMTARNDKIRMVLRKNSLRGRKLVS
jgi:hypothetical protein